MKSKITATCEVKINGQSCGKPITHAYEASGNDWMALCAEHAQKHLNYATPIAELLARGETLYGERGGGV